MKGTSTGLWTGVTLSCRLPTCVYRLLYPTISFSMATPLTVCTSIYGKIHHSSTTSLLVKFIDYGDENITNQQ
jgi:hypothetical protein